MFHGLDCEVLAHSHRGDGRHLVLRLALGEKQAVLKLYGRKRGWLRDSFRDAGHRWLIGKTGMSPRARWRTERDSLAQWRRHGIDVPATLDLPLPPEIPPLRLLMEYVPGEPLSRIVGDPVVPLSEKDRLIERLAVEWGRRHALALAFREPRLVQSHVTLSQVLRVPADALAPERLVTMDFEVAWARRSALPRLPSLEIAHLLDSIARCAPLDQVGPLIAAFVRGYPDGARLSRVVVDVNRGRLPLFAWISRLGLLMRERGPRRKLAVLRHFEAALAQQPERLGPPIAP